MLEQCVSLCLLVPGRLHTIIIACLTRTFVRHNGRCVLHGGIVESKERVSENNKKGPSRLGRFIVDEEYSSAQSSSLLGDL